MGKVIQNKVAFAVLIQKIMADGGQIDIIKSLFPPFALARKERWVFQNQAAAQVAVGRRIGGDQPAGGMPQQADRFFDNIPDKLDYCISGILHIIF